jgi:hypothetical protein
VRDAVRAGGHDHHVIQEQRPARDERHELVERVPRERRGPAALRVQRVALDVRHRGQDEEDAGEQEDHRREAEGVARNHAEREVHGRTERARADDGEAGRTEPGDEPHPLVDRRPAVAADACEPLAGVLHDSSRKAAAR